MKKYLINQKAPRRVCPQRKASEPIIAEGERFPSEHPWQVLINY
jgi:hypothetical protein